MQLLNRIRERVTLARTKDVTDIPPAEIYSVLSNKRRRLIVEFLATHDDVDVDVSDIADHIAEETDCNRNAAYISAIQNHCPVLDTAGIIDYRERDKVVECLDVLEMVYKTHKQVEKITK